MQELGGGGCVPAVYCAFYSSWLQGRQPVTPLLHRWSTTYAHLALRHSPAHHWFTEYAATARPATMPTSRARCASDRQVFFTQQCAGMALRRSASEKGGGALRS